MIGGSTTSLLGILSRMDYDKYEVDLLLDVVGGEMLKMLPKEVNVLESAYRYPNHRTRKFHNFLSPQYMWAYLKSREIAKKSGSVKQGVQYLEMLDVEKYRPITKKYDIAIAFLEGKNCKFVANHVIAGKKIGWIHIDYKASGFNPEYDIDSMSRFDRIVTVSDNCKDAFDESFPPLADRCIMIENLLSKDLLLKRSKEKIDFSISADTFNLITTCRIVFSSKGLDRAVRAFASLKDATGFDKLRWYILGDGPDMPKLKNLISEYELENTIIPLGNKTNPYPYLREMQIFFLPSVWEGKPMAVTEAFMLGLPVLATNYLSAHEQIRDGIDGKIVDNSQNGIKEGIEYLLKYPEVFERMRVNVENSDYSNDSEMQKINNLLYR